MWKASFNLWAGKHFPSNVESACFFLRMCRYTGSTPNPPPGSHYTSPSENMWNTGSAYSMNQGMAVSGEHTWKPECRQTIWRLEPSKNGFRPCPDMYCGQWNPQSLCNFTLRNNIVKFLRYSEPKSFTDLWTPRHLFFRDSAPLLCSIYTSHVTNLLPVNVSNCEILSRTLLFQSLSLLCVFLERFCWHQI